MSSSRGPAPDDIADFFGTDRAAQHITLRRLRLGNGRPYAIDNGWYNSEFAPDLLENDVYNSVYSILDRVYGVPVTQAEQTVTAVAADEDTARLLDVTPAPHSFVSFDSHFLAISPWNGAFPCTEPTDIL